MPRKSEAAKAKGAAYTREWLQRHPDKPREYRKKFRAKFANPPKSRVPWSDEELAAIHAPGRPNDSVLARQLGRTPNAISIKRSLTRAALARGDQEADRG